MVGSLLGLFTDGGEEAGSVDTATTGNASPESNGNKGNKDKDKGNISTGGSNDNNGNANGNTNNTGGSQNQSGILFPIDGEVSELEFELIGMIKTMGKEKNYELVEYVNDVNRQHTEVLMELNINGIMDTAYSYGNERLTEDSYLGNSIDPLTLKRYNYVKSSPLNYIDPSGCWGIPGFRNAEIFTRYIIW